MYHTPIDRKVVRRVNTPDGEFTLFTDGTIKFPTGEGKDINDLLNDPILVDNKPGNVFQVVGGVLFVAALRKDAHVVDDMLDSDDGEPAYHSQAYLIAIDWRSWSRLWDRDICLGGLTTMAVSDDAIFVAGFRESYDHDETRTIVARLSHSGELIWIQDVEAGSTPHPTEIDLRPGQLVVYVDSFNLFQGRVLRFKMDMDHDGHLSNIVTL